MRDGLSAADRAGVLRELTEKFRLGDIHQLSPNKASAMAAMIIRTLPARRIGRNERCPCGSGKKFKHCCGARQ